MAMWIHLVVTLMDLWVRISKQVLLQQVEYQLANSQINLMLPIMQQVVENHPLLLRPLIQIRAFVPETELQMQSTSSS